jgi:hypothetical protein
MVYPIESASDQLFGQYVGGLFSFSSLVTQEIVDQQQWRLAVLPTMQWPFCPVFSWLSESDKKE